MSDRAERTLGRIVLTAGAQRTLDAAAVAAGVLHADLMESAGRSAAEWILDRLRPANAIVLSGPGGNGGDGLVVARLLQEAGVKVRTVLLRPAADLSKTTRVMLDRLQQARGRVDALEDLEAAKIESALTSADWVVDGLFGSGLTRPLDGPAGELVERVNGSGARIVSLDLPSGLSADAGALLGVSVHAEITLAMAFLKPAHLLYPASGCCGNVAVVPVAYPEALVANVDPWGRVPEPPGVAGRLPARRPDGHKGTFGRVLVVAGSIGMTGAAILACRGALRAGAGLVSLAAPASLSGVFDVALSEVILYPLPETDGRLAGFDDARFLAALDLADVLAIGPGLARAAETGEVVRSILRQAVGRIVLDADGILACADDVDLLRSLGRRLLLTPHPGELGLLLDRPAEEIDRDRVDVASALAVDRGNVVLLKGRPTVVATPEGERFLNPTGNTGLATGGSGDVLTGLIAGFAAGGASLEDAAVLGAYVHGWAAEVFSRSRAERSLTPSDVLDLMPEVLREVEAWN